MRLVVAAALGLLAAVPAFAQPVPTLGAGETLLSVEARGEHKLRPDTMTITAATVTTGATAPEAVRANAVLAERLIAAVRRSGVEARDVRTSGFTVGPRFARGEENRAQEEDRPPRITGYVVANQFDVRFRDLTRASEVIEALFTAGANRVRGPIFSLADPLPARRLAEQDAVRQAMAEARNYAQSLGKRIGRILRVSERRNYGSEQMGDQIVVTGSRIARTPVEPGELSVAADIFLDVALVD